MKTSLTVKQKLIREELHNCISNQNRRSDLIKMEVIKRKGGYLLAKPSGIIKRNIRTIHDIDISIRDVSEEIRKIGGVSKGCSIANEKFRATALTDSDVLGLLDD